MKRKQLKEELLDDMRICILYEPNQEEDLLYMMSEYMKRPSKRKELAPELVNCVLGKPYKNPYEKDYPYSIEHVAKFHEILNRLEQEMETSWNVREALCRAMEETMELHKLCEYELFDEWRIPKVEEYFLMVAESIEVDSALSFIQQQMRW